MMVIRVMLQQLQAEQIHRGAATKLMFESAAAGALTHQVVVAEGDTGAHTPAGESGQGSVHYSGNAASGRCRRQWK